MKIDRGVYYMVLASMSLALMSAFVKLLSEDMSSVEAAMFRNLFGVIFIAFTLFGRSPSQAGGKFWLLIFRGLVGTLALLMYFYNISQMNLADAITFSKTAPIFTAILAYVFLKEKLSKLIILASFLGFVGMLFVIRPAMDINITLVFTGVLSGFLAGLAYTSIRELKNYYEPRMIVLSFVGMGSVLPACLLVLGNFVRVDGLEFLLAPFVMPDLKMSFYIAMMGLFGTLGQFLLTKAYSATKAGIVGAASYLSIFFAAIIGLFIGQSLPDLVGTIGITMIVLAGIMASTPTKKAS